MVVSLSLFAGATACVSDPAPAPTGGAGQACLPNGTCNGGLVCAIVSSIAQCEPPGAVEGGAGSCSTAITTPKLPCPAAGGGSIACYEGDSPVRCVSDATTCANDGGPVISPQGCFSEKDCGSGDLCCLQDGAAYDTKLCPGTLNLTSSSSACGATLSTGSGACSKGNSPGDKGDAILCTTDAGCPKGMTCYPVRLNTPVSLQGQVFGLCL